MWEGKQIQIVVHCSRDKTEQGKEPNRGYIIGDIKKHLKKAIYKIKHGL